MAARALAAYRALLRARAKAFARDARALDASLREIRHAFDGKKTLSDAEDVRKALRDARDAAMFLRTNVARAERVGDGAFAMVVDAEHASHVDVDDGRVEGCRRTTVGEETGEKV